MGLWKDKTRKDWCYKFQVNKKQYGSRGYATKKEAIAARAEHRKRVQENTKQILTSMGFREAASLYLDDAKRRFVVKTYKYKAYVFKNFLQCYGDLPIEKITTQQVDTYLKMRKTNHNFNVHRKELHALFVFARDHLKVIFSNPVSSIAKLPHTSARKKIPTEQDIKTLLSNADEEERAFIICLLNLAARVDEVLRLTWSDIDFEKRTVTRWTKKRKGGMYEPITTYMNEDLFSSLKYLKEHRIQSTWVFYNEETNDRYKNRRKKLYGLCKRSGIDRIHYHELRHFIASLLANSKNVSKKTISDILGHKSLTTTEIYLHSIDGSQKLAIQELEGRFSLENEKAPPKGATRKQ